MPELFWPIAYLALLLGAIFFVVVALFQAFHIYSEITPHKRYLANIVPFLVGVLPGLLTPAGQQARNKLAGSLVAAGFCAAAAALIMYVHGPVN